MRTLAQARKARKELLRDLKKAETARHKATVAKLRQDEKNAKIEARRKLKLARELCKENVIQARAIADEAWQKAREVALEARRAKKRAARQGCELAADYIRKCAEEKAARAKAERVEAIRFRAELARLEAANKQRGAERSRLERRHKRSESDDAVRSNIPENLIPLFESVKRTIKATDRLSRTEAFLHYAEENPGEVYAAQEAEGIKQLERDLRQQRRDARGRRSLEAVPF